MKKLHQTSQYKRDLKRYAHNRKFLESLRDLLLLLAEGESIPKENKPHVLIGDYKNCWECHVQSDILLIWIEGDIIELLRLGSHSDLFGSGRKR